MAVYFYKSALIGFEIGLHNYKAPLIGKKSLDFADQALKKDPQNPFAFLQLGNINYYTPPIADGVERYLSIFKAIFEKTGHIAHYNMMMDIQEEN